MKSRLFILMFTLSVFSYSHNIVINTESLNNIIYITTVKNTKNKIKKSKKIENFYLKFNIKKNKYSKKIFIKFLNILNYDVNNSLRSLE